MERTAGLSLGIVARGPAARAVLLACLWFSALAVLLAAGCSSGDQAPEGSPDAGIFKTPKADVLDAWQATVQAEGKDDPKYHLARQGKSLGGRNIAQGFDLALDDSGFGVIHKQGGWNVRLESRSIHCGEDVLEIGAGRARGVQGEPHSASIARKAGRLWFEEWVINGPLGLEQGFTLPQDPCRGKSAELVIDVAVSGLAPVQHPNRIVLQDAAGADRATVSSLVARDSQGRELSATMAASKDSIRLSVAVSGAVWPVVIDPLIATLVAELDQDDGEEGARFGESVAVSGDAAIVGSWVTGAAYVFEKTGTGWGLTDKLVPNAVDWGFGRTVAIDGNQWTAMVGSPNSGAVYIFQLYGGMRFKQEDKLVASEQGVTGFGTAIATDGTSLVVGASSGSAYVFVRSGVTFAQQAILPGGGTAVSIKGDTAISGRQGAAYIYARNGTTWSQQAALSGAGAFGSSVAVDGDLAVIGAPQSYVTWISAGSVVPYTRSGTTWTAGTTLYNPEPVWGDQFGWSVALSGTTVLIGAPYKDLPNPEQGVAYFYSYSGGTWTPQGMVRSSTGAENELFGSAVSLSGTNALIGLPNGYVGETDRGTAKFFVKSGTTWSETATLVATENMSGDEFGSAVAVRGNTAMVGAYRDDFASLSNGGSVFVFGQSGTSWLRTGKLKPLIEASDFGRSIALDDSLALIGASGAAYVFAGSGTSWTEQQKLTGGGFKVALSGPLALSATQQDAYIFSQSGTSWSQQDILVPEGGATTVYSAALDGTTALLGTSTGVHVFVQSGTDWTQQATLTEIAASEFGKAVALQGDLAVVGTAGDGYSFRRTGSNWEKEGKLVPLDPQAFSDFGYSLSLDGETAVLGAPKMTVAGHNRQGAAYVFVHSPGGWSQASKLVDKSGGIDHFFGSAVSVSGSRVIVGAPGVNDDTGKALIYELTGQAGMVCSDDSECASSYRCSDNVCCTSACSGPCDVCSLNAGATRQGICKVFDKGSQPLTPCAGNLVCNGKDGFCPAACLSDAECAANNFCTSAGTCQPTRPDGAPCDYAGDCKDPTSPATCHICEHESCVDGVCCDSPCSGACDRCDLFGTKGICTSVPATSQTACGAGFVCDGLSATCPTSCTLDSNCQPGYFCNTSLANPICVAQYATGTACDKSGACLSGFCIDGFCCNQPCGGSCQSCAMAYTGLSSNGQCGFVKAGEDPHGDCPNESPSSCGTTGTCAGGSGNCAYYDGNTICASDQCDPNKKLLRLRCDPGTHTCKAQAPVTCDNNFGCINGACAGFCTVDAQCTAGYYCLNGGCTVQKDLGAVCGAPGQCKTGMCTDGHCCGVSACGTCQQCGVTGGCVAVPDGQDPRNECPDEGQTSCGRNGNCNGASACAYYAIGSTCGAGHCSLDLKNTMVSKCDGSHACKAQVNETCVGYNCSLGACLAGCGTDGDCQSSHFCQGGKCLPKQSAGAVCAGPNQCASGFCTDGVCCNEACLGACKACKASFTGQTDGTCDFVMAGLEPPSNDCPLEGKDSCGANGKCDGAGQCQKWASGTSCGAVFCDDLVLKARQCNGLGLCITTSGSNCSPYACMPGDQCPSSCTANSNCAPGYWCNSQGTCQSKYDNGMQCQAADQCESGYCVDGVCCNQACTGTCRACSQALKGTGADGDCGNIPAGVDPSDECDPEPGNECGADGMCSGAGTCRVKAKGLKCGTAGTLCVGNVVTGQYCDGLGFCSSDPQGVSCAPYLCQGEQCGATCVSDTQCVGDAYCSSGNECVTKGANGAACTEAKQCTSGFCVDGFCCDTACSGTCQACAAEFKEVGADGVCGPAKNGEDPHNDCETTPSTDCKTDGKCDGTGKCRLYPNTTACGTTACDGNLAKGHMCDGLGLCKLNDTGEDCSPNLCGAQGCGSSCSSDTQCADDAYCTSAGQCEPRLAAGKNCTTSKACKSGFCADGICCDSACTGQCEACDVTGKLGTCTTISGKPHGNKEACAGEGTCAGTCNGTDSAACAYPGAAVECGSGCKDDAITSSVCSGDGKCVVASMKACAPFGCDTQGCKTVCTKDADCVAGTECDTTTKLCLPKTGGKCDGEHTVTVEGTNTMVDCKPYKCSTSTNRCETKCTSDETCVSGFVCDETGNCVQGPSNTVNQIVKSEETGCGCSTPGRRAGSGWLILAALGLLAMRRR